VRVYALHDSKDDGTALAGIKKQDFDRIISKHLEDLPLSTKYLEGRKGTPVDLAELAFKPLIIAY